MTEKEKVYLGSEHYRQRIGEIREYAGEAGLEGLLLLNPYNVMWASGFFHIPNERALGLYIPADGRPTFYVPLLEKENAEANGLGDVRWYWEYPGEEPAEVWMLREIEAERVAIDGCSHALFGALQAVKPALRLDGGVGRMRYYKTDEEIRLTELAGSYADYGQVVARQAVAAGLQRGITEVEVVNTVKREVSAKMLRELEDMPNSYMSTVGLTVHAGPRGALPHGQPGLVTIKPGDTLIVGIGAQVGGFHAESGCTYVVGEPTGDQMRCLEATWACDQAALEALKPGATCSSVNDAALAVLREAGFGDYIRHRIGHGMGVQGHEAPWLSVGDETILEPSMVFSNEPGIYRPGVDGYRIIDSMVVTPQGGRYLSHYLSEHGPDDRVIPV
jgi:Xaa-Pro dipeptidase